MSQFRIVEAVHADLPALGSLLHELFTLESDFEPDTAKQAAGLRLILDNPALGRIFVLRVGENVVGMANALVTVSTAEGALALLLEDVIVAGPWRGKGLGARLVNHVLAWARGQGYSRATLLADRHNPPALRFYEKLGFRASAMRVYRKKLS
ncbi:MAG: GNAT family N-acetyltransferase [Sulfuricella sp.]